MAEAFTSYKVDNDRSFRNALQRASEVTSDLRVPFALILSDFYRSEKAIFSLKGPGQYPPFKNSASNAEKFTKAGRRKKNAYQHVYEQGFLSPYQKAKIKAVGFDYPLLVRTGSLAASLLSANARGAIAIIAPTELTIGTTIPYGIYHQSDAPRKKIPLRKFLFIGPEASQFATSDQQGRPERWMNILNDYTLKKMKQSGAFNA